MSFRKPIYLDNNSTTPLDPKVLEAMMTVLTTQFGNPASSTHSYGWYAEELVKVSREKVAQLINAFPEEIVFTSGATESNNLAIKGLVNARRLINPNEKIHIVSVTTEHRAVLDTLSSLKNLGVDISLLEVNQEGDIDPETLLSSIKPETKLVSIMLANNEIGTIHDIKALCTRSRERELLFHCDATQALGKIPVDVKELKVDMLSISAHKIYGPKGIGALYIRKGQPKVRLEALIDGGGHEHGLRSGTLNMPGIVGFGEACNQINLGFNAHKQHLIELSSLLLNSLRNLIPGIKINGSPELNRRLPGNLNLSIDGIDNSQLIGISNSKVAMSISSACQSKSKTPSHVLQALGISEKQQKSSFRLGVGKFNSREEIIFAADAIAEAVKKLKSKTTS